MTNRNEHDIEYSNIHTNNVSLVNNYSIIKIINGGDPKRSINAAFPTLVSGTIFCTDFNNKNNTEQENNYTLDLMMLNDKITKSIGNKYEFVIKASIHDIETNYESKVFRINKLFIYDQNKDNKLINIIESYWN